MTHKRRYRGIIAVFAGIVLLFGQLAFAMEPSVAILGDIVGKGSTEMRTAFGKWISVSGRAYPLIDGANLRSAEGSMSSIFRDGARIEIGRNSEIIVAGAKGNYTVDLKKGKIAFSIPEGVRFSVITPTSSVQTGLESNMIRTVNTASRDFTRGTVGYDGKGTTVTVLSGTLMVRDAKGAGIRKVAAGNSLYVAGADTGYRPEPAQLLPTENKGNQGSGGGNGGNPPEPKDPALSPLVVGGASLVLVGGTFLIVNSTTKGNGVASPSQP
ncbi:MAG: FecR family protein [Nitrospirae bacterium]|nr:FecR family protein [Nitrospirota bacterium]